ncbi:hypothetical protein [Mycobacterium malmoense]|uniref:hypothetical protein n=1 Tax=Mycobacterium malmoense TaxID=1780 RepID=UPI00114D4B1C|nr:hypothetical protein [Mycobacterium malmoense]
MTDDIGKGGSRDWQPGPGVSNAAYRLSSCFEEKFGDCACGYAFDDYDDWAAHVGDRLAAGLIA